MFQNMFQNDKKMLQRNVVRVKLVSKSEAWVKNLFYDQFKDVD